MGAGQGRRVKDKVRFYDEHERRYLPNNSLITDLGIRGFLQHHKSMKQQELADANRKLETDTTKLT